MITKSARIDFSLNFEKFCSWYLGKKSYVFYYVLEKYVNL